MAPHQTSPFPKASTLRSAGPLPAMIAVKRCFGHCLCFRTSMMMEHPTSSYAAALYSTPAATSTASILPHALCFSPLTDRPQSSSSVCTFIELHNPSADTTSTATPPSRSSSRPFSSARTSVTVSALRLYRSGPSSPSLSYPSINRPSTVLVAFLWQQLDIGFPATAVLLLQPFTYTQDLSWPVP